MLHHLGGLNDRQFFNLHSARLRYGEVGWSASHSSEGVDIMNIMNEAQKEAMSKLRAALELATKTCLFDDMAGEVHPEIINDFCDAVEDYYAHH